MRLLATILLAVLTTIGSTGSSATVPSGLICHAFSKAEKVKSLANPLTSLRDVRYRLSGLPFAKNAKPGNPYFSFNLLIDLHNPRIGLLRKIDAKAALDRLAQLEDDATKVNFDGAYFGYELRGFDKVREGREIITSEIAKYDSRIESELKRRYPTLRIANIIHHGMSAGLIGSVASLLIDPASFQAGLAMSPIAAMAAVLNETALPYLRRSSVTEDFDRQLKTIDEALASSSSAAPLHIVSGSLEIRTELHQILMTKKSEDLNDDEVQFLVDAAEKIYKLYFDDQWESREFQKATAVMSVREKYRYFIDQAMNEARYFPEGRTRQAYYDIIFYFDTETKEPVWLFFYRAFKTKPLPPKSPKLNKPKEKQTSTEDSWIPGLKPQLAPIPIR